MGDKCWKKTPWTHLQLIKPNFTNVKNYNTNVGGCRIPIKTCIQILHVREALLKYADNVYIIRERPSHITKYAKVLDHQMEDNVKDDFLS